MNYIGSKLSLLEFLEESINKVVDKNCDTFCDLFAGTGIVGSYFKRKGYKIIANDIQYYSYVLNRHYIGNHKELNFAKLLKEIPDLKNIEVKNRKNFVCSYLSNLKGIKGFSHRDGNSNLNLLKLKLEDVKNIDPANDGIMLAALKNKDVLCMVIADGMHVSKEVVGLLKDYKKDIALVSDDVSLEFFNQAKSQGMLGGGQLTLDKCVSNLINWKVSSLEDSLIFASKPISSQLKIAKKHGLGQIEYGKEANITFWDTKKNAVKGTIMGENVFLNY